MKYTWGRKFDYAKLKLDFLSGKKAQVWPMMTPLSALYIVMPPFEKGGAYLIIWVGWHFRQWDPVKTIATLYCSIYMWLVWTIRQDRFQLLDNSSGWSAHGDVLVGTINSCYVHCFRSCAAIQGVLSWYFFHVYCKCGNFRVGVILAILSNSLLRENFPLTKITLIWLY